MAAIQSVTIKGTADRMEPKPHTVYEVHVEAGIRTWSLWHRYSEFVDLHDELVKSTGAAPPAPLPPKHAWTLRKSFHNGPLIKERQTGLETYLRAIISSKDSQWRDHYAFRKFLGVPAGKNAPPTDGLATSSPSFTSASWIEEHNELETLVRDIRSSLNKRDSLWDVGDMRAASSSNVQAKRSLIDLVERIGILAKGLEALSTTGMTQGEVQRRTDMVSKLQDDCEKLNKIVAAARQNVRARPATMYDKPTTNDADRTALFGASGSSPPTRKPVGRVLGATKPPQETVETRPLDDHGLLQLQKQKMQNQDQLLDNLSSILTRQKHIGQAISTEVDEQIKILDEFSADVDRVSGKLGSAKKTLNRLS